MSLGWTIGAFLLVLTPIILVHELGHFIAARLSGIRVEEFGIGFPPRAVKLFKRGSTLYSLNWIPVGGFVRPAGEDDPSVPDGLAAASKKARFFVLIAGAGANFLFALLLLWIAFMIGPKQYDQFEILITGVNSNSPAFEAGLQPEDVLLAVNSVALTSGLNIDEAVDGMDSLKNEISSSAGSPVTMLVRRGDEEITILVTPRLPGQFDAATEGETGIEITATGIGDGVAIGPVESVSFAVQENISAAINQLTLPPSRKLLSIVVCSRIASINLLRLFDKIGYITTNLELRYIVILNFTIFRKIQYNLAKVC